MEIRFTRHALIRLIEREISPEECEEIFLQGKVIEIYENDKPFPSDLRIGNIKGRILHVVSSVDNEIVHIITAYEPHPALWNEDFTKRKI